MLKNISIYLPMMRSSVSLSKASRLSLFNNKLIFFQSQLNQLKDRKFLVNKLMHSFSQKKVDNLKRKLSKQQAFKIQQEQLMKQNADEDPHTYEKASGIGGKALMGLGILSMGLAIIYYDMKSKRIDSELDEDISGMVSVKEESKKLIGSDWSLINEKGQAFSSTDLAGSYYLIYFGFTKCPDICPATLIKLSRVLKLIRKMPENNYLNLKVVFVSVDPDRDNPKRIRQYLKNFDQEIIGVTGLSNEDVQLKNTMKGFKIYANKITLPNKDQYSMDHTTITYLMDDDNKYVDHLNPTLTEQQMAKAIVNRILQHDFKKMKRRKNESN